MPTPGVDCDFFDSSAMRWVSCDEVEDGIGEPAEVEKTPTPAPSVTVTTTITAVPSVPPSVWTDESVTTVQVGLILIVLLLGAGVVGAFGVRRG